MEILIKNKNGIIMCYNTNFSECHSQRSISKGICIAVFREK